MRGAIYGRKCKAVQRIFRTGRKERGDPVAVQKVHPSLLKLRCGKGNVELKGEDAQPKENISDMAYRLDFR